MGKLGFADVIRQMEKVNVSRCSCKTGLWKPGLCEHGVFDEVLRNLEK